MHEVHDCDNNDEGIQSAIFTCKQENEYLSLIATASALGKRRRIRRGGHGRDLRDFCAYFFTCINNYTNTCATGLSTA